MIHLENGGLLLKNGSKYLYNIGNIDGVIDYYYGIINAEDRPSPQVISHANIIHEQTALSAEVIEVEFQKQIGYPVFAISYVENKRLSYFVKSNNRGTIKGQVTDFFYRLFPNENIVFYHDQILRVYIGAHKTYFDESVKFKSYN